MWDGLDFFAFDEYKLRRLEKGKKRRCCDKFCSLKWLISIIFAALILIYILTREIKHLGEPRIIRQEQVTKTFFNISSDVFKPLVFHT